MLQDIGKRNDFAPPIIITVPDHLIDRIVSRNHQTKGIVFLGITNGEFQQIEAIVNRERFFTSIHIQRIESCLCISQRQIECTGLQYFIGMPWRES